MQTTPPIPIAIPKGRSALSRLFIELTMAFNATTHPRGKQPKDADANQTLVAVAVMLGHAEGKPMNATQIAKSLRMPRSSALRRLDALVEREVIQQIKGRYYLEPIRARLVPHLDEFELILSKAFDVLGPILSKTDR